MRSARAALRAGDAQEALRVLDRHRREYATGQMNEDRDALRAAALCDAGQIAHARAASRDFASAYPGSLHVARVKKICATP